MSVAMNLVTEAWIPVLRAGGGAALVSLAGIFQQGEAIADLAVRPHERVALLRLLQCVAHAALDGPQTRADWEKVPERLPQAAAEYLERWKERFWLVHPQYPFLQIPDLRKTKEGKQETEEDLTPFAKLDFSLACGNTATLFDHVSPSGADDRSPARLALALLTFQHFSPGGLISQVFWAGQQTSKSSCDAPCVSASMLHAFPRGRHLSRTIQLNLCPLKRLESHYRDLCPESGPDGWIGRPVWEHFPASPKDAPAVLNATKTFLGRLVPLSRAVLLRETGLLLGEALVYPGFSNPKRPFRQEPSATLVVRKRKDKEEPGLLGYRPDKAVWRELHALLVREKAMDREGREVLACGPATLENIRRDERCDLVVAAVARDQADIVDTLESVFLLGPELLSDEGRRLYEAGVRDAEDMAARLGWALETFRDSLDGSWREQLKRSGAKRGSLLARLKAKAMLAYWTAVEGDLHLLFDTLSATDATAGTVWRKTLFRHALDVFDTVCARVSGLSMKDHARGRVRLTGKPKREDMS